MGNKKWTDDLVVRVAGGQDGDLVDVIVEIQTPERGLQDASHDRTNQIELRKKSFAHQAKPIVEKIAALGGQVSDQAWLSSSITARLPRRALEELGMDQSVDRMDVVRPPERD